MNVGRVRVSVCSLACSVLIAISLVPATAAAAPKRQSHRRASGARVANGDVTDAAASPAPPIVPPGIPIAVTHTGHETSRQIMERESLAPPVVLPVSLPEDLPYPNRNGLPQNPNSPEASASGETVKGAEPARTLTASQLTASPSIAQSPSTSFTGATLSGTNATGAFPPDSMGAVGPMQYVVAVNGRIVTFSKTTGLADGVLNTTTDTFFASLLNGSRTSDPRVRYDRLSGRWFIIIITVSTPNRVLIAFSDAASAGLITSTTVWSYNYFDESAGTSCLEDYPTLGIDNNALYIGTNSFCGVYPNQTFAGNSGYVVAKAGLLAGAGTVTRFALVPTSSSPGPYTPQGVDNYDPSSTEGYFIGIDNASFGTLMLRRVSNPGGTPTISGNIAITVSSTSYPNTVPHEGNTNGTSGNLDSLDDRLFAAQIRNGHLWTAHNITVGAAGTAVSSGTAGGRVGVRWYELAGIRSTDNSGVPLIVQSGTFFDSASDASTARNFWIPSIMVSGQHHAALGFSAAGANYWIDAAATGRWSGDALGTLQPFSLLTSSSTAYNPSSDPGGSNGRRWGDYSYTSVDPLDDMTMWTIQEFCDATNSYGVRITKLVAPPPATPSSLSPATINTGLTSTIVTLAGTSSSGSGFFDPGPDLGSGARPYTHLSAAVSGGVTVNSVTYVDPTHVTLNLNTVAAVSGLVNVTITNPDGQKTTGTGILTVNTSSLAAPANVVASAFSTTQVRITWAPVTGASSYDIARSSGVLGSFALVGNTTSTTFDNAGLTAGTSYLYEVRAVGAGSTTGPFSAPDLATTTMFTDDPVVSGTTTVKAIHIAEIRAAVNAVRKAANLSPYSFTDPGSLASTAIRSVHITELRSALDAARALLVLPSITYTNSAAAGTLVRSIDVQEIRNGTK